MKFIIKKIIETVITLFVISLLVFVAFNLISGDAALAQLGTSATPERVEALRDALGLNEPLPVQYGRWLFGVLKGDWGTSYSYRMPVGSMIGEKLPVTLTLTLMSFVMMVGLTLLVGIFGAKRAGGAVDRAVYVINQVVMAIPPFFSGILITLLFGIVLKLFTPGGYVSYEDDFVGFVAYLFFPALAVAIPKAAMGAKLLRSAAIEEINKDYVRTAYSRGNSSGQVFNKHVLKNALLPSVTFWGMALADMVMGSIIVEQVFSIPGLGRILLTSISNRDFPVVQALVVGIAFFVIVVNVSVDLIYRKIDPRVTVEV